MSGLFLMVVRFVAVSFISFCALSTAASAISISTVGSLDLFKTNCGTVNGDAAEIACIEGVSGGTATVIQKFSDDGGGDLPLTLLQVDEDPTMYALLLPEMWRGGYFLLKTGNISDTPGQPLNISYIFQNLVNKDYAVFKINDPLFPNLLDNVGKVSHITAIQVSPVPLPAAAWMFLCALGGIFGFKRVGLRLKRV